MSILRYDCCKIRHIWSDQNKYLSWMKIELAFLKRFMSYKGLPISVDVPSQFSPVWQETIEKYEDETRHDLAAFVRWLEEHLKGKIGDLSRYVHYGLTSSDIVDTAFSLMIKETNLEITHYVNELIDAIAELKQKHGKVRMLGRTHGQAAEVINIEDKCNAYIAILIKLKPKAECYGRLAGSVGDSKYFSTDLGRAAVNDLGLKASEYNDGQIIHRAVFAEYMNEWAMLASAVAKIATDIRLLAQSGIEEFREEFGKGQMGSSSMPQKRNPILCENICGLARVIRGHQVTAMQNIELWNERDISHSSAERLIFPDSSIILGFMLKRMTKIIKGLDVNKENIERNLESCRHAIQSQEEMLHLITQGDSRTDAHRKIKEKALCSKN